MTPTLRRRVFLVAAVAAGALLLWGLTGLPDYGVYAGPYGDVLNQVAVAERKAANVVAAVTFDYRGIDTMGEEFILFAAVLGVAILLRAQRDETEQPPDEDAADRHAPATSNAVRVVGLALVGPVVLFGLYVVTHGHLSPGGGFQGGVVLATAALLVYLSGEYVTLRRVSPEVLGRPGRVDRRGRLRRRSACSAWPPGRPSWPMSCPWASPAPCCRRAPSRSSTWPSAWRWPAGSCCCCRSSWSRPWSSAALEGR